jgi:hypothetical protein
MRIRSHSVPPSTAQYIKQQTPPQTASHELNMSSNPPKRIEAIAPITPPTTTTIMTLNAKVEAAVAPYASLSSHAPTFSIAEIMVMAWVCRKRQDRNYVSDEEVSDWMILTFGAHRKMALEELYKHSLQNCDVSFKSRTPFHNLAFQKTAQIERQGGLFVHPSWCATIPASNPWIRACRVRPLLQTPR